MKVGKAMKQYYSWPDLGEEIKYEHLHGCVVTRNVGELFFTIHDFRGDYYNIDLADFIVDQIKNPQ